MAEARDVHGPWEHQGLARALRALRRAGRAAAHRVRRRGDDEPPAARAARRPRSSSWPADRSNPVYEHLGAWWNNAPLVQECFGGRIDDVETMRRASQWLQYDGLRYAVEATIRRGAGCIPWQFNESFPNAWCTAAVDWHGEPKPAYWGVARAYARRAERAVRDLRVGRATTRCAHVDGRRRGSSTSTAASIAEGRLEISAPLDRNSRTTSSCSTYGANRYVMTTHARPRAAARPAAQARLERDGDRIRNVGDVAAIGLVLGGDVIDLLPGEERTVEGRVERRAGMLA